MKDTTAMKPNFALDLSHAGIGLLHRAKGGWTLVGEVALDDPELGEKLSVLRKTASDLESGGINTKLIIPNSQVLFAKLKAPGPDDIAREVQIRTGLEGRTPYAVGDLVFDWRADGKKVHVAVVARETLNEAEAFAKEHRLNPVSFVARAQGKTFRGEPFFGKSTLAASILGAGEQVQTDKKSVPRLSKMAEPEILEDAPAGDDKPTEDQAIAGPEDAVVDSIIEDVAVESEAPKRHAPDDETLAAILAEVPSPAGFEPVKPAKKQPPALDKPTVPEGPDVAPPPILAPFPPTLEDGEDLAAIQPTPPVDSGPASKPKKARPKRTGEKPRKSIKEKVRLMPTFSSRRESPIQPAADLTPKDPPSVPGAQKPAFGKSPAGDAATKPDKRDVDQPKVPVTSSAIAADPSLPKVGSADPKPKAGTPGDAPGTPTKTPRFVSVARKGLADSAGVAAQAGLAGKSAAAKVGKDAIGKFSKPPKPKPADTAIAPAPVRNEAEELTVFGARQTQSVGGKPKFLGLFLMLALLLLMAIAAIWSMFFFGDSDATLFNRNTGSEFTDAAEPPTALPAPDTTSPDSQIAALPDPGQPPAPPVVDENDPVLADSEPEPGEVDGMPLTDILSQEAAQARYAATGIWQKAPLGVAVPGGDRIDDLYIASIDPKIPSLDAVALPSSTSAAQDTRPPTPLPPPPNGAEFALDENGLVRPTAEGALTPEGVLVFLGKPPVIAPPRPGTAAPLEPVESEIPRIRPRPRPADLVEGNERANLGGVTRVELASFRPRARPASPQQNDEAAATAPTELALAASPKPNRRPGDFATIVKQARSRADASDGSSVVAASAAATTVPSIPTRASVATQATVKNAINLRKINLIGVYGSSSARRALVRLSNGRYVKVGIGDRLNGGKVTAITSSKLVYKKNGKNYTLKVLPLG